MTWTGSPTSTGFSEDDRLVIKYYITNTATMGAGTCTLTYDNAAAATGDSLFQINETITFKANTDIGTVQGLTKSSVGTVQGLTLASVGTIEGLS